MRSMPPELRGRFDAELATTRNAWDTTAAWTALERAHILSQPWARPHVRCHLAMLGLTVRSRDLREFDAFDSHA